VRSRARTALDHAVTLLAALASAGALRWLAHVDHASLSPAEARLGLAAVRVLGVASIAATWLWFGLLFLATRVLRLDWKAPGLLNLTCLLLGTVAISCFGGTLAMVMAGFAGPPQLSTTIGIVTFEGGSGWAALDRLALGVLTGFGWTAAFLLGMVAILGWLGVAVAAWRAVHAIVRAGRA
jgi:hypothetical protein